MKFLIEKNKETIEGIDYDVIIQDLSPDPDSIKEFFEKILVDNRTAGNSTIEGLFNNYFTNSTGHYNNWSMAIYQTAYPEITKETMFNKYIGLAEVNKEYAGASTIKGTINKKESIVTRGHKSIKLHYVFDFPTHACNGTFDTIHIYHKPLQDFIGGIKPTLLNLYAKNSSIVFQDTTMGNWFNVSTDNNGNFIALNTSNSGAGYTNIYYCIDGKTGTFPLSTNSFRGGCYLNNKFYMFPIKDWHPINWSSLNPVEVTFDNDGNASFTLLHNSGINLYTAFLKYTDIVLDQGGVHTLAAFEWDDEIFFVIQEMRGSSSDVRRNNVFIGVTDKEFNYKRFKKYVLTNPIFATGTAYDKSQNLYYSKETGIMYIFNEKGGIYFDKNFETIEEFTGNILANTSNRIFTSPNNINPIGVVTVNNKYVFYHCGEVNILHPLINIKLRNPMTKNSSETMKLTFDVTIESK